ncbi:MAG: RND family transporter [Deltaproteobacteria bacterium]|nr:RND family transporter [Deltaproteobacteria bacterium]
MNKFIGSYIRFVIRMPKIMLFVLAVISLILFSGMFRLKFDQSIESFMPQGDPEYMLYQKVKAEFGDNDRFIIMAVSGKPIWSTKTLLKMDRLISDLEEFKEFDEQKELRRIHLLKQTLSSDIPTFSSLLAVFSYDPAYDRFLRRTISLSTLPSGLIPPEERKRILRSAGIFLKLKKRIYIDKIISPLTMEDISGNNDTLETYPLIDKDDEGRRIIPVTQAGIAKFKKRLLKNPAFRQGIYAVDPHTGRITDFCVIIKFTSIINRNPMVKEVRNIIASYPELHIIASGVPYGNYEFNEYMQRDLYENVPLVLLVMTIIFFLNFRSLRGVILPLTTLGLSTTWTMGLMGFLGIKITTVGITLPPLLIAVGSSYSIHILNQYYADFDLIRARGVRRGLFDAMSHISTTVILSGLTTFAAFMTLITSRVSAIEEWGVFSAIGVLFSVLIAITLIPAALELLPLTYPAGLLHDGKKKKKRVVDRVLVILAKGAVKHYKKVFAVTLIVIAISLAGALRMKVDTEFLHYFKPDDPMRINSKIIGDKFGGGWGFDIVIDSKHSGEVKTPEFLKTIEKIRKWLTAPGNEDLNVGRTDAFSDFIKRMNMAMNGDDPKYYRIPDSKADIVDYLEIFSGEDDNSDGRVDAFEPFVDADFSKINMLVRLTKKTKKRVGTSEIRRIIKKIDRHLDRVLPRGYTHEITGYPVAEVKLAYYVVSGQMWGLALSLGFVCLVIMLLFRRFAAGPLALIDMVVTIIINFGVMGWFGISLDAVTSIIAAITVGIGVDDTIHFLNSYRSIKTPEMSVSDAIEKTMYVSGKAILFTSLALVFGFVVLVTSNFLPVVLFALLIALTMVNTTIGSILLVPSAIRLTGIDLDRRK